MSHADFFVGVLASRTRPRWPQGPALFQHRGTPRCPEWTMSGTVCARKECAGRDCLPCERSPIPMAFYLFSLAASFVIARVEYPRREDRCNIERASV